MSRSGTCLLLILTASCTTPEEHRVFGVGDCFSITVKYTQDGEEDENDRLVTILKEGEGDIFMHPFDAVDIGGLSAEGIDRAIRKKAEGLKGVDVLEVRVDLHGRIELPEDPRELLEVMVLSEEPASPHPVFTYPPMKIPGETREVVKPHEEPTYRAQLAVSKMFDLGVEAFPVLIESLDDGRQSVAVLSIVPCTLGAACYGILFSQVNVGLHKGVSHRYDFLRGGIPEWWKERKGRTLEELQVEAAVATLVKAEAGKNDYVLKAARARLAELDVEGWETMKATHEELRKRHAFPMKELSIPELIDLLVPEGETYVERLYGRARTGGAWSALKKKGTEAIPLLIESAARGDVGAECLDILKWMVQQELLYSPLEESPDRFSVIEKETVRDWWEGRSKMTLRELKLDAAREWLAKVEKARFPREEVRQMMLKHVRDVIKKLEAGK